ncbi:MAG: hypothetical protein KF689_07330 [Gemmatimonadaceae bacterium]|nr:hypothetical protein [Gemmatimonadaceae bacterium]MCW5825017.1 hypothetical protein [Gemmatimonadaceae bacterium]
MRLSLVLSFTLLLCTAPVALAQRTPAPFRSADGDFAVPVPRYNFGYARSERERMREGTAVHFRGDAGEMHYIESLRAPRGWTAPTDSAELVEFLSQRPREIHRTNPTSRVLAELPIVLDGAPAMLVVLEFPEGHTLMDQSTRKRLDSVRAFVAFTRNGYLYLVGTELNGATSRPRSAEQHATQGEQALRRFLETMRFTAPSR